MKIRLKNQGETPNYFPCSPYTFFVVYRFLRALQQNRERSRDLLFVNNHQAKFLSKRSNTKESQVESACPT